MIFYGLQKMTLLDYPGRVACTVFTGGCNFRCPFCHNATLVEDPRAAGGIDEAEILAFLAGRRGLLDGVCVTGGEPLLHDLASFLKKVKEMGFAVKLDTNGTFPAKLRALVAAGLVDYVAVDVKNAPEKYAATAGVPAFDLAPVRETVAYLLTSPVDFEFRTTVVAEFHEEADVAAIAAWIAGAPRYFLQNFVDSGNLIGKNLHPVAPATLEIMRKAAQKHVEKVEIRGL